MLELSVLKNFCNPFVVISTISRDYSFPTSTPYPPRKNPWTRNSGPSCQSDLYDQCNSSDQYLSSPFSVWTYGWSWWQEGLLQCKTFGELEGVREKDVKVLPLVRRMKNSNSIPNSLSSTTRPQRGRIVATQVWGTVVTILRSYKKKRQLHYSSLVIVFHMKITRQQT